jgi:hypothetical protein
MQWWKPPLNDMRAKAFERALAEALDVSYGELDQRVRPLRAHGMLPSGGRGPHAPHITTREAALMVLACVSRRATDAYTIAQKASALVPGDQKPIAGQSNLSGLLAVILNTSFYTQSEEISDISSILIDENGSFAYINRLSAQSVRWAAPHLHHTFFNDLEAFESGRFQFGRWFLIGRGFLQDLAETTGLCASLQNECSESRADPQ